MEYVIFIIIIVIFIYYRHGSECNHSWIYHNRRGYKKCYYCNKKEEI